QELEGYPCVLGESLSLLWREESGDALDQASQGVEVELVTATKVVNDASATLTGLWITEVMCELDVLSSGGTTGA
ncbi:MAG: hypothetical protein ACE5JL_11780, partial [Dehalococcoidia bacterium]